MALAVQRNLKGHHMDVVIVLLQAESDEEIYLQQNEAVIKSRN